MFKFKDHLQKLYALFPIEIFLNSFVICMITCMIFTASLALNRPVSPRQYNDIQQYSQQAAYPKTQQLAKKLQQQPEISIAEYFRLRRAYNFEKNHIKQYPAVDITDPQ